MWAALPKKTMKQKVDPVIAGARHVTPRPPCEGRDLVKAARARIKAMAFYGVLCLVFVFIFIRTTPAHAQNCGSPPTNGLVGYWQLDETGATTTATDSSGNGINGTMQNGLSGNDSTDGVAGTSLTFGGTPSDHSIDMSNVALDVEEFSLSLWMKTDAPSCGIFQINCMGIARKIAGNGPSSSSDAGWFIVQRVNDVDAYFYDGVGNDYALGAGNPTNDNKWYHVVLTRDASKNTYLYVNGDLVDSGSDGYTIANAEALKIGDELSGARGGANFDGNIDEVRYYDRALDVEEIAQLYQFGLGDEGAMIFNKDNAALEYCNGADWRMAGMGSYNPNAVRFDGVDDFLRHTFTGASGSKKGTLSLWFKRERTGVQESFIGTLQNRMTLGINSFDGLGMILKDVDGNFVYRQAGAGPIDDTDWHHLLMSWDVTDPNKVHLYIDDVDSLPTIFDYVDNGINYDTTYTFGTNNIENQFFQGSMADFWFDRHSYIDFSKEENRRRFISEAGMPMYLGPDGSLPMGKTPEIFLSGDTENWHVNKGTGGGYTENGELSYSSTRPGDVVNLDPLYTPVSNGLAAWWKMDETSGTTAVDSSGNGNNASVVGSNVTWENSGAVDGNVFVGPGSALQVTESASINGLDTITISAWVKGASGGGATLLQKSNEIFLSGSLTDQWLRFEAQRWDGSLGIWRTPNDILDSETWSHIAFVYDYGSPSNDPVFYLNGEPVSLTEVSAPSGTPQTNATDLFIGNLSAQSNDWNNGIDDVRIYNRGLSALEIKKLYNVCAGNRKGAMKYDVTFNVMTYCNGVEWVAMGPVGGTPPTNGLIAHWEFDETSGTTAADNSGNNLDGNMGGGMDAANDNKSGMVATALDFDGVDDAIGLGSPVLLDDIETQDSGMTLSAWVYQKSSSTDNYRRILQKRMWNVSGGEWSWGITNGNRITFQKGYDSGKMDVDSAAGAVNNNTWHHVLMTWDGSADAANVRFYIDGEETAYGSQQDGVGNKLSDASWGLSIGSGDGNSGRYFHGLMDDVRIYNRVLSEQEITGLYRYGLSGGLGDVDNGCSDEGPVTGANAEGQIFYNIDNNVMQYCNGEEWVGIGQ